MNIKLPSRYEDLDESYRGKLIPNQPLITLIDRAYKSMRINGGIRFVPIYGMSGIGKSCATRELSTHMPDVKTILLFREEIESKEKLLARISRERQLCPKKVLVTIIDQYEESVQGKEKIPSQFIEHISLLDRDELKGELVIFVWLTTSKQFQKQLADATSRNSRILIDGEFEIKGPDRKEWPDIVEETFSFHNEGIPLADYGIIHDDIKAMARSKDSLGKAIEEVGVSLYDHLDSLENLSEYQIIILWPVADATRSQRVVQFAKARSGYQLNWDTWYAHLNEDDKKTLPLHELNRTRLYFDVRIIPVRAADLHPLCIDLDNENRKISVSPLKRFQKTHFYHVASGTWADYDYAPMRERDSERATKAKIWYESVTTEPTKIGKRIAKILRESGLDSEYEQTLKSEYSKVRADVLVKDSSSEKKIRIIELKAFSSENTMPSAIKEQIKITLRRHAQFAGFLQKQ